MQFFACKYYDDYALEWRLFRVTLLCMAVKVPIDVALSFKKEERILKFKKYRTPVQTLLLFHEIH